MRVRALIDINDYFKQLKSKDPNSFNLRIMSFKNIIDKVLENNEAGLVEEIELAKKRFDQGRSKRYYKHLDHLLIQLRMEGISSLLEDVSLVDIFEQTEKVLQLRVRALIDINDYFKELKSKDPSSFNLRIKSFENIIDKVLQNNEVGLMGAIELAKKKFGQGRSKRYYKHLDYLFAQLSMEGISSLLEDVKSVDIFEQLLNTQSEDYLLSIRNVYSFFVPEVGNQKNINQNLARAKVREIISNIKKYIKDAEKEIDKVQNYIYGKSQSKKYDMIDDRWVEFFETSDDSFNKPAAIQRPDAEQESPEISRQRSSQGKIKFLQNSRGHSRYHPTNSSMKYIFSEYFGAFKCKLKQRFFGSELSPIFLDLELKLKKMKLANHLISNLKETLDDTNYSQMMTLTIYYLVHAKEENSELTNQSKKLSSEGSLKKLLDGMLDKLQAEYADEFEQARQLFQGYKVSNQFEK